MHASNPIVPLPHMPISSLQYLQMFPRPTGSRQIEAISGPLQNYPDCIALSKTWKTSQERTCHRSSGQPSIDYGWMLENMVQQ